jgi:hypothetical protein
VPSEISVIESKALPAETNLNGPGIRPISKYAEFTIAVQSGLPNWGVAVEALSLLGPEGELPPDRLRVRTSLTGGDFRPLSGPAPVVAGDYRLPVCDSKIIVSFTPSWKDPAGQYTGRLLLRPYVPDGGKMSILSSETHRGLIANDQEVQLTFSNNETIMIEQPKNEVAFELLSTPSGREAVAEVEFTVSTNASRWRVVCESTFLDTGSCRIPTSRIGWRRLDEYGHHVESGNMGEDATVLEGFSPVQDLKTKLKLILPLSPSDLAGSYVGQLTFTGVVEGTGTRRVDEREIVTPNSGE